MSVPTYKKAHLSQSQLLSLSQIQTNRQSVNTSMNRPDVNTLEESFCNMSKKKLVTLPCLDRKKDLLIQIDQAIRSRLNDEVNNSIFLHKQYNRIISNSTKTLKSKPVKRKRLIRQQSVIETQIKENCTIKGIWVDLTHISSPPFREFSSMVEYNGNVYILGGFGNSVYNDFYSYNLRSNKWKQRPPVTPRYGHTMTIAHSSIYLIGGEMVQNFGKNRQKSLINEIQKFDGQSWSVVRYQGVFESRKYHACATYRENLVISGGEGNKGRIFGETSFFDLQTMKISNIPGKNLFPNGIIHHAMAETKENLYLYGGSNASGVSYEGLYSFNPIEGWRLVATVGEQPPRLTMHSLMYFDPFLLLYGGKIEDMTTTFSNQIYGLRDNEWFKIAQEGKIPAGRAGHSCCISDDRLLVFGGFNLNGYMSSQLNMMELRRQHRVAKSLPNLQGDIANVNPILQTQRRSTILQARKSVMFQN